MTQTNESRCSLKRFGIAFFALMFITFALEYGVQLILKAVNPELLDHPAMVWILSTVPLYFAALPVCMAILGKSSSCNSTVTSKLSVSEFFTSVVVSFGVITIGNLVGNGLMLIYSLITGSAVVNPIIEVFSESNPAAMFFIVVIVAPLGEEFIFRRIIIDNLHPYGERFAVILSAAMFAAFHTNIFQIPYAFLVGVVFGYIYIKTGKLRYSVILHAIINFSSGFMATLLLKEITALSGDMVNIPPENTVALLLILLVEMAYVTVLFGCAIATVILAIVYRKKKFLAKSDEKINVFKQPFIMLFFAVCLVLTVVAIILG